MRPFRVPFTQTLCGEILFLVLPVCTGLTVVGLTLFQSFFAFCLNIGGILFGCVFYALMRYFGHIHYNNSGHQSTDATTPVVPAGNNDVRDLESRTLHERLLEASDKDS